MTAEVAVEIQALVEEVGAQADTPAMGVTGLIQAAHAAVVELLAAVRVAAAVAGLALADFLAAAAVV